MSHSSVRPGTRLIVSLLTAGLLAGLAPAAASADPATEGPFAELQSLALEAEKSVEDLHVQGEKKAAAEAAAAAAQTARDDAARAADEAQARREELKSRLNAVAGIQLRSSAVSPELALLVAENPSEYLEGSAATQIITTSTVSLVRDHRNAVERAESEKARAADELAKAQNAAREASDAEARIQEQQGALKERINDVTARFDSLSPEERNRWREINFPDGFDPVRATADAKVAAQGSSVGARALSIAMTKAGSPYVWGAAGPDSFDCSGLVYWSYQQLGITLPRSSQAQSQDPNGTPVSKDQLQPGDVVFFYDGPSHVGIYAGNGNIFHASTYGVPVGLSPMSGMPFHSALRY